MTRAVDRTGHASMVRDADVYAGLFGVTEFESTLHNLFPVVVRCLSLTFGRL